MGGYRSRKPSGAHTSFTQARVAVEQAAGVGNEAIARKLGVPSRTIRAWQSKLPYWGAWLRLAAELLRADPPKRLEQIAETLVERLQQAELPRGAMPLTDDEVASLAEDLRIEVAVASNRWDLPAEAVLRWVAPPPAAISGETALAREHHGLALTIMNVLTDGAGTEADPPEPLDAQLAHEMSPHELEVFFDMIDRHEAGCQLWRGERGPIPGSMKTGLLVWRVASALESGEPAVAPCPQSPWCCNLAHFVRKET